MKVGPRSDLVRDPFTLPSRTGNIYLERMGSTPDDVFAALERSFDSALRSGQFRALRREGDEALLLLELGQHPQLFGVRVPLTKTDRRLDWDHSATSLEDWLESVHLWLMEDVENWYIYGATRSRRDGYIELALPAWPNDPRFEVYVDKPSDIEWLSGTLVADASAEAWEAVEVAHSKGELVAVIHAHDSGSSDTLAVAVVCRRGSDVHLADAWFTDHAPGSLVLAVIRAATHAGADAGAAHVHTVLALPHLDIAGFRPADSRGGLVVDTDFMAEDPAVAAELVASAVEAGGDWGKQRDADGRLLPSGPLRRLRHRLRHGRSGAPRKFYAG